VRDVLAEIGKLVSLESPVLIKLGMRGMLGFDEQILIFISISSCLHQHNVDTGWKILPGVGMKATIYDLAAPPPAIS